MINPKEALHTGALHREQTGYLIVKRIIDIGGAAFGLLVLSPLLLLIALAIKLEDRRGPVLFSQIRIGKNGKPFRMYKFRSMVCDAEARLEALLASNEIEGAMFKMKEDPRVTRIGRFIRRTSLDEIPQFLNVLRGEMSLVGPRPPLPREVEQYTYYEKQRLLVTPGCTGLWQISGRNELSFQEMVELDLRYIRQRSIRFDLSVIVKTAGMLLGSKDAY
ncbi:sugar transferase [Paenibacillus sp. 1P07SE]|uniref:sugar transferase n=1 Tax=Paenibacillus sp. 1P07SE TaxID=3132209 RepID=UPI0039A47339